MQSEQNHLFDQPCILDYNALMARVNALENRYSFLRVGCLGTSVLGRSIPLLTLGNGTRKALYVATHHGMEWITSALLLRFVNDLCTASERQTQIGGAMPHWMLESHTLYIVPMLNPDGAEYQIHGLAPENPLYERVLKMNGNSEDFSHWQANARGVDLNHNYDAGFAEYKQIEIENGTDSGSPTKFSGESPESEPETAALANLIRTCEPSGVMTLHTQGEEIFYQSGDQTPPRAEKIAQQLASVSGYRLSCATGTAAFGGLTDWCVQSLGIPSFTVECGFGKNPLPYTQFSSIYCRLRRMLFLFPMLL
ncbi:MAG: M14 family metallocarboxypeptidase [Clostridia bacterium]|nr:M14 family metallocarboxypeptidase [Clostridia bacterium]